MNYKTVLHLSHIISGYSKFISSIRISTGALTIRNVQKKKDIHLMILNYKYLLLKYKKNHSNKFKSLKVKIFILYTILVSYMIIIKS